MKKYIISLLIFILILNIIYVILFIKKDNQLYIAKINISEQDTKLYNLVNNINSNTITKKENKLQISTIKKTLKIIFIVVSSVVILVSSIVLETVKYF